MKIIDAHCHFELHSHAFQVAAHKSGINFSSAGLAESTKKNNIIHSVIIGFKDMRAEDCVVLDKKAKNPIMPTLPESKYDIRLTPIAGINPHNDQADKVEEALKSGKIKGLKIFLGYYHFAANYKIYYKFYELAEKYKVPVIFHTGDTYSKVAKLKFSQSLPVDEVAVDFPKLKIVIAHIGNPNIMEAAQVLYKNENVFADLSGLIVGRHEQFATREAEKVRKRIMDCFDFSENPKKFMFGSDWPLASHDDYIEFIKKAVPEEYHEDVFYNNAKRVFEI